jgi:hypothetical protein
MRRGSRIFCCRLIRSSPPPPFSWDSVNGSPPLSLSLLTLCISGTSSQGDGWNQIIGHQKACGTESIEWLMKAFPLSYDFAPSPPPPPSPVNKLIFFFVFLCVATEAYWREREPGGDKTYDGEKAWSSINHSILSGLGGILSFRSSMVDIFKLIFLRVIAYYVQEYCLKTK